MVNIGISTPVLVVHLTLLCVRFYFDTSRGLLSSMMVSGVPSGGRVQQRNRAVTWCRGGAAHRGHTWPGLCRVTRHHSAGQSVAQAILDVAGSRWHHGRHIHWSVLPSFSLIPPLPNPASTTQPTNSYPPITPNTISSTFPSYTLELTTLISRFLHTCKTKTNSVLDLKLINKLM